MEVATAAALVVAAPLTISGYAHIKDCLRISTCRVKEAPSLLQDAFAIPSDKLRIRGAKNIPLHADATLLVDGRQAGSYLHFNGEDILLAGDEPSNLRAVAALGGSKVTSEAHSISVLAWEAPRELALHFSNEQEAVLWADALREAAKLQQHPIRLDRLIERMHTQDLQKKDLQSYVDQMKKELAELKAAQSEQGTQAATIEDNDTLERLREGDENKRKVGELEEKLRDADSSVQNHKTRADAAEERLKDQGTLHAEREVDAVFLVDSTHSKHKEEHPGLAFRRSMKLEDKETDVVDWGKTVAGKDLGNGWVQVGERFLPTAVGDVRVVTRYHPSMESIKQRVTNVKDALAHAVSSKEQVAEIDHDRVQEVQLPQLVEMEERADHLERRLVCLEQSAQLSPLELEDRADHLEHRLLRLEQSEQQGQCQDKPADNLDVSEHEELLQVLETAEARRQELEERARALEQRILQMELDRNDTEEPQALHRRTAEAEARVAHLEAAHGHKDQELTQLKEVIELTEKDFRQRTVDAESRALQLQGGLEEREKQIVQLKEACMKAAQELAELKAAQSEQGNQAASIEALYQRVEEAEERESQLHDIAADKDRQLEQLHEAVERTQLELTTMDAAQQEKLSVLSTLSARITELESSCSDKDRQIDDLVGQLAVLTSTSSGNSAEEAQREQELQAYMLRAAEAEGKAAQLQEVIDQCERQAVELQQLRTELVVAKQASEHLATAQTVILRDVDVAPNQENLQVEAREALLRRAEDAEARVEQLQIAEQALIQQVANAEGKLAELRALTDTKEQHVVRLESLLTGTEEAMLRRATDAETKTGELQQAVIEKDNYIAELVARFAEKEQEIAQLQEALTREREAGNSLSNAVEQQTASSTEEFLQRAKAAEAEVVQLQMLLSDKDAQVAELAAGVATLQQEYSQRADAAETERLRLQELVNEKDLQVVKLAAGVTAMEQEIAQLRARVAEQGGGHASEAMQQQHTAAMEELFQRATDAEARVAQLQELEAQREQQREQQVAEMKVTIAAVEEALYQRTTEAEARVAELQVMAGEKDQQLVQLNATIERTEQDHRQRTADAEAQLLQWQGIVEDSERQITQLKEIISKAEQEITELQEVKSEQGNQAAATEVLFQRVMEAEAKAEELQAIIMERNQELEGLKSAVALSDQELGHLRAQAAEHVGASEAARQTVLDESTAAQAHLQRALDAEANTVRAQALVDEKHMHVVGLKQDLALVEQELAKLREDQVKADEVTRQSLLDKTTVMEAYLQRAENAEARAVQLQVAVDEKTKCLTHLETSAREMMQELAQLRAASAERAETDKAGKQAFLQEARAAEDIASTRVTEERSVDEGSSVLLQAAALEERTAKLQVLLEERDREIASLHTAVKGTTTRADTIEAEMQAAQERAAAAEREAERLQLALVGKDEQIVRLLEDGRRREVVAREATTSQQQLSEVQAREAQLTKYFEDEKSALRRHMAEQFETEYTAIRKQVTQTERELQVVCRERDALKQKLGQVGHQPVAVNEGLASADGSLPPALVERLAAIEITAEETKIKLQATEQECDELRSQKAQALQALENERSAQQCSFEGAAQKASHLAAQLTQLEQEKVALQQELSHRAVAFVSELEEIRMKVKHFEEAFMQHGGMSNGNMQEQLIQQLPGLLQAVEEARAQAETPTVASGLPEAEGGWAHGALSQPAHAWRGATAPASEQLSLVTSPRAIPNTGPAAAFHQQVDAPPRQVISPVQLAPLSPVQGVRMPLAATQVQKQRGAAPCASAGVLPTVSAQQQPSVASTAVGRPTPRPSVVSPVPSYVGQLPVGAAPLQSAATPQSRTASPLHARAQEQQGPAPMIAAYAPRQMQVSSPKVSPMRLRPKDPVSVVSAAVVQRPASPAQFRSVEHSSAPAVAVQVAASMPTARGVQPLRAAAAGAGLSAPFRQSSDNRSWIHGSRLEVPSADTAGRRVQTGVAHFTWSAHPSLDPSPTSCSTEPERTPVLSGRSIRGHLTVPAASPLRSDSHATLVTNLSQGAETAFVPPAAPCGGIIASVSPVPTNDGSGQGSLRQPLAH